MMINEYIRLLRMAERDKKFIKDKLTKLDRRRTMGLQRRIHEIHDEVFAEIDCLKCGNCCREVGPRIIEPDITRIAKDQNMKKNTYISHQLEVDEDGDWVFKNCPPCPYLGEDNYCSIYDVRPRSCKDYPHTKDRDIHKRLKRLAIDTQYCPAAYLIAQKVIQEFMPK